MATTRIQLALNVEDLAEATEFYTRAPRKLLNHLGVEASAPEDLTAAVARFRALGLTASVAEQDVCCHATQDKAFVTAPDVPLGWWEYYVVTDDNPADSANPDGASTSECGARCAAENTTSSTCCS